MSWYRFLADIPRSYQTPGGRGKESLSRNGLATPVVVGKNTWVTAAKKPMAADLQSLEERVTALERLVVVLRTQPVPSAGRWLDRLTGSVTDDDAFAEAGRLGQEYRRTGRVPDDDLAEPGA